MKSGFVSLIGRPNVGKSTLLNTLIKEKVAITSNVPGTTRNIIQGIYNEDDLQIVFMDTPGIIRPINKLCRITIENSPYFGSLFLRDGNFEVPSSLEKVKVRGGTLQAFAFYLCPSLREIDACGVPAQAISKQAFAGMEGLVLLHTPRADVELDGEFTARTADCGCTIYERKEVPVCDF